MNRAVLANSGLDKFVVSGPAILPLIAVIFQSFFRDVKINIFHAVTQKASA